MHCYILLSAVIYSKAVRGELLPSLKSQGLPKFVSDSYTVTIYLLLEVHDIIISSTRYIVD